MANIKEIQKRFETSVLPKEDVFDYDLVKGPHFEHLVDKIAPRIEEVNQENGKLQISLKGEVIWDSWAVPSDRNILRDKARLTLVARAATYVAAVNKIGEEQDMGLIVEKRDIEAHASAITSPHPWYNIENSSRRLRPVKLSEALSEDPQGLIKQAYPKKKYKFAGVGLGSVMTLATACQLAESPPPGEVIIIENPDDIGGSTDSSPTQEGLGEIIVTPSEINPTSIVPNPELTPTANLTSPYPQTEANFILGAGGPQNAEERLRELGAGADIDLMQAIMIQELVREGIDTPTAEFEIVQNELSDNPSWSMWLKVEGSYYFPLITEGDEAGQLIRSGNLFNYLDRGGEDFFDLVELSRPESVGEVELKVVNDRSGWAVIGAFNNESELVAWFNADQDRWTITEDYMSEYQYIIEDGRILERAATSWEEMDLPENVGEIVLIEKHDGRTYAINEHDVAVLILTHEGMWARNNLPVRLIRHPYYSEEDLMSLIPDELLFDQESRLIDGEGNLVPFGYLYEKESSYEDTHNAWVSGIVRGVGVITNGEYEWFQMVWEIPLRYERVVIASTLPYSEDGRGTYPENCKMCYAIPDSGNIDERERIRIRYEDLVENLHNSELIGNQIVISYNSRDHTDDAWEAMETVERFTEDLMDGSIEEDYLITFDVYQIWSKSELFQ